MLQESDIIPYHLSRPPGEKVLVLAPHPDDETLGCGGTLRLLVEAKKIIKVVFLTSGDKAEPAHSTSHAGRAGEAHITRYALSREKEAEAALGVLGVSHYQFLRFPDRGIHEKYESALGRLQEIAEEFQPDTIYTPSMLELNPDHRAAADLSLDIQRAMVQGPAGGAHASPIRIVFYEVTTPLRPNMLVDITTVFKRKRSAVRKYKSQLRLADYLKHITALNTFRSLTVKGSQYVEAFWSIDGPLSSEESARWLSFQEPL
jgi:LmbE family N-acetylglucosaminyl deacetylase